MMLPALKVYLEFDSKRLVVGFYRGDKRIETVFLCVNMNIEMFY